MLIYVYRKDLPLRLKGQELWLLVPDLKVLKLIFSKGLPMGIQMIVVSSAMLTMMRLVNQEGVNTTAAFGATQQLWTYVQMPAMALGAAVSAMAAQNIGAGKWDRVNSITRIGVFYAILMTGILVLCCSLPTSRPCRYSGSDSPAIPIGQHIGKIATWGFIAFGVSMVLFGTVRANGQVIWPLIILFVSMYPVRLGVAVGMRDWLGPDALWLSFPVAMLSTMLMAGALYLHGGWRKNQSMHVDKFEQEGTAAATAQTAEAAPSSNALTPNPPHVRENS